MADERTEKGQLETKFPLSPIRNLLLQEISGAGIYFCKLEPRIPIQSNKKIKKLVLILLKPLNAKNLSLYWDRLFATMRIIKGECTVFAAC